LETPPPSLQKAVQAVLEFNWLDTASTPQACGERRTATNLEEALQP
jgi:hypothetical protein